jgi:hypothetical protein
MALYRSKAGRRRVLKELAGEGRKVLKASPERDVSDVRVPHLAVGRNGGTDHPAKSSAGVACVGRATARPIEPEMLASSGSEDQLLA